MTSCTKKVRIGDLRELITIEQEQAVLDAGGGRGPNENWVALATLSAAVKPLRGTEDERGGLKDVRVVMFTIRRRGDITSAMRIIWNGRPHNIDDIRDPGPQGSYMELIGKSGVTI